MEPAQEDRLVRTMRTQYLVRGISVLALLPLLAAYAWCGDDLKVTEISPSALLFSTAHGNVVASVGPDGALRIGTPSQASTDEIANILSRRTQSAFRAVVIGAEDSAHSGGRCRLGQARSICCDAGKCADADFIAHFHSARLVYLGEVFPGDGYPEVDSAQRGSLDGFLSTLEPWTMGNMRFVPARGALVSSADVKAFRDMITSVRDRVQAMAKARKSEREIVAAHPTAEFDARWGHGHVAPDAFVREVYVAVTKK